MEISEKQLNELFDLIEACFARIRHLDNKITEMRVDYDNRWDRYAQGENRNLDILEMQTRKQKKMVGDLTYLYEVVQNVCKVVFPERHVEGIKPDLLIERDPKKMV